MRREVVAREHGLKFQGLNPSCFNLLALFEISKLTVEGFQTNSHILYLAMSSGSKKLAIFKNNYKTPRAPK
jgi:hypothetical protein